MFMTVNWSEACVLLPDLLFQNILCWNVTTRLQTLTCSTYSRPIGVISDSLGASSCSLHPSCHLVTPSLKEVTNVRHLMSHISQGHTGAIWVTVNKYLQVFLYFFKRTILCQRIHGFIFCLKCDQVSFVQHISNISIEHIYVKGFYFL